MNNNELMHYGVLGMKWGVRRARKNYEKAAKAKTRGDKEAASLYEAKAKKIESKHRQRVGSKTYDRLKTKSTGELFAKSMLMGTYGTLKFEQAKTRGSSTGKAVAEGLLYQLGNGITYGWLSIVEPRLK